MKDKIIQKCFFESPFIKLTKTNYSSGVIMNPHTHKNTAISLILKGTNHETVNGKTRMGHASNLVIKPANITHENLFSENCTIISIYLKQENKRKIVDDGLLSDWNWFHYNDYSFILNTLVQCRTQTKYYSSLNACIKHLRLKKEQTNLIDVPYWLTELKKNIESNYCYDVQTKNLAKEFNVHPVYLGRIFRQYFGLSIKEYLKILRVNFTVASIIDDDKSLCQIALNNGFSDQSHMNKVFKSSTKLTPNQLKKLIFK